VPWNRPLYKHLGFRVLGDEELSLGLRALRDDESAHGLDPELRVCMRKPVRRLDAKPAGSLSPSTRRSHVLEPKPPCSDEHFKGDVAYWSVPVFDFEVLAGEILEDAF
jgi:hypothetical protein